MSELPGRPDLDQLRRQARELLRAATDGDQQPWPGSALSERVSLSAAQLAVAREHGFASWPGLRAEAERRLAVAAEPGGARHLLVAGRNRRHHDSCRGTVTDRAASRPRRGCPGSFARAVGGDTRQTGVRCPRSPMSWSPTTGGCVTASRPRRWQARLASRA